MEPTDSDTDADTRTGPPDGGPRVSSEEVKDLGRLRRSITDRHVSGLCAGIARHLDIDPILVRVAMVVLVFFGGAGLLIYAVGWIVVPEEGSQRAPLGFDDRTRSIVLVVVLGLAVLAVLGDLVGGTGWFPWPLVVLALLVLAFLDRGRRRDAARGPGDATAVHDPGPPAGPGFVPAAAPVSRRPGPVLFWPVLALIALGVGALGVVDLAGVAVPASAYPALGLAITGATLVVGAWWGRGGGLIALGLLLALATAISTVAGSVERDQIDVAPTSASEVRDTYEIGAGEIVVDLSGVTDVDALDGRDLTFQAGAGRIEVVLPDGMDVAATGQVGGPGEVTVLDDTDDGISTLVDAFLDGGDEVPDMRVTAQVGVGEIVVRTADQPSNPHRPTEEN